MRDLGPVSYLLGVEIIRDRPNHKMWLSQRKYIRDILGRFQMTNALPVATPVDDRHPLSMLDCPKTEEDRRFMSNIPYLSAVGCIMWLAMATRPDLAYAASLLGRFSANPGRSHWEAVKRVLRYLVGTTNLALEYGKSSTGLSLTIYSDAGYAGDKDNARSTGGYTTFVGDNCVNWESHRQKVVAKSTAESELIAANEGGSDAVWSRKFFDELGLGDKQIPRLFIDNQTTIRVGKNPEHHSKMKHILTKYFWIREAVENGRLVLEYVPTAQNPSDILTKALGRVKHQRFCDQLGLHDLREN